MRPETPSIRCEPPSEPEHCNDCSGQNQCGHSQPKKRTGREIIHQQLSPVAKYQSAERLSRAEHTGSARRQQDGSCGCRLCRFNPPSTMIDAQFADHCGNLGQGDGVRRASVVGGCCKWVTHCDPARQVHDSSRWAILPAFLQTLYRDHQDEPPHPNTGNRFSIRFVVPQRRLSHYLTRVTQSKSTGRDRYSVLR